MFIAAGQIIPSVTGKSWDDFVNERIFAPLGMVSSNTSTHALEGVGDVATLHIRVEGSARPIAWRNLENGGHAAGINSNVVDMAQWIRLQLGQGTYQGKPLFSAKVAQEMWSPQTIIPTTPPSPPLPAFLKPHLSAYGFG